MGPEDLLENKILEMIDEPEFREALVRAEALIRPTVVASCVLQGKSTLASVVHGYGMIYRSFVKNGAPQGNLQSQTD